MCQQKIPSQPNEKRTNWCIGLLLLTTHHYTPNNANDSNISDWFWFFAFAFCCVFFYFVFQQMLHQLLMLIQKAMHMRIMYKTRAENWQNSHNHNHSLGSLSHTWLSTLLWMMAIVMCDVYTFFSRSLAHSLSHCLRTYIFSSLCRTPRSIWDYSFIRLIDVLPIAEICHPEYSWNVNGLIAWNH